MSTPELKLGIWQDSGVLGDVAANLKIIDEAAAQAKASGVDLLVFPECFLTGYYNRDDCPRVAAQVTPAVRERIGAAARQHGLALVVGIYEPAPEAVHNSALVVDRTGQAIATYRKRALFGKWEKSRFRPGLEAVTFDCLGLKIGVLICYDVEFPELVRDLARRQVDVVVVPTALMSPHQQIVDYIVPARAFENQLYVAYANRMGTEHELTFIGQSRICDPTGNVLAKASPSGAELIVAPIEKSVVEMTRSRYSYLDDLERLQRR